MKQLEIIQSKILNWDNIQPWLANWRFHNQKIVFTNGCFDILHMGHIEYLSKAADLGQILIIGLNTDESVRRLKGNHRPINPQDARATILASMRFVDAVIPFDQDTPYELIKLIQPDVLVKGADYKEEEIVGYDIVRNRGGAIKTINLVEGFSTTGIEERIRNQNQ